MTLVIGIMRKTANKIFNEKISERMVDCICNWYILWGNWKDDISRKEQIIWNFFIIAVNFLL